MNEELITRLRTDPIFDSSTLGNEAADALEAAQPKDPCSTCGAQVNHYRNGCPGCGAPVCCESCCRADNLRGELAYQLTKQLVIDIPTARAAVDAAFRASTEAAQPAGEPVAYVDYDGFIVERNLDIAPGQKLYLAPGAKPCPVVNGLNPT